MLLAQLLTVLAVFAIFLLGLLPRRRNSGDGSASDAARKRSRPTDIEQGEAALGTKTYLPAGMLDFPCFLDMSNRLYC